MSVTVRPVGVTDDPPAITDPAGAAALLALCASEISRAATSRPPPTRLSMDTPLIDTMHLHPLNAQESSQVAQLDQPETKAETPDRAISPSRAGLSFAAGKRETTTPSASSSAVHMNPGVAMKD